MLKDKSKINYSVIWYVGIQLVGISQNKLNKKLHSKCNILIYFKKGNFVLF